MRLKVGTLKGGDSSETCSTVSTVFLRNMTMNSLLRLIKVKVLFLVLLFLVDSCLSPPPTQRTPGGGGAASGNGPSSSDGTTGEPLKAGETAPEVGSSSERDVVVFGDSLGQGLFAYHNYGQQLPSNLSTQLVVAGGPLFDSPQDPLAVLQHLDKGAFVAPIVSAYGGESPYSLKTKLGISGKSLGGTISAGAIGNMAPFWAKLETQLQGVAPESIEVVIFAVGQNDFCAINDATFNQGFKAQYLAELKKVREKFTAADIFVIPPIDVVQIALMTAAGTMKIEVNTPWINTTPACAVPQKAYCPTLAQGNPAQKRLILLSAISEAVAELAKTYPAGDKYGKTYYADLKDLNFTTEQLAADCFHLNSAGHEMLGGEIFKRSKTVMP
jgi:hypothetical protein